MVGRLAERCGPLKDGDWLTDNVEARNTTHTK